MMGRSHPLLLIFARSRSCRPRLVDRQHVGVKGTKYVGEGKGQTRLDASAQKSRQICIDMELGRDDCTDAPFSHVY